MTSSYLCKERHRAKEERRGKGGGSIKREGGQQLETKRAPECGDYRQADSHPSLLRSAVARDQPKYSPV